LGFLLCYYYWLQCVLYCRWISLGCTVVPYTIGITLLCITFGVFVHHVSTHGVRHVSTHLAFLCVMSPHIWHFSVSCLHTFGIFVRRVSTHLAFLCVMSPHIWHFSVSCLHTFGIFVRHVSTHFGIYVQHNISTHVFVQQFLCNMSPHISVH
jgi:hypothetical protein